MVNPFPYGANSLAMASLGVAGRRIDPYMGYNFLVEIDGLITGGFSKVEGLESTIQTEEFIEGGENHFAHRVLKHSTHANLVLVQGLTEVNQLWSWFRDTCEGRIQRKDGTIMMLDDQRLPVMWWDFRGALPVKWTGPSFDASGQTVAVSKVELIHQGLTKPMLSTATEATRLAFQLTAGRRPGSSDLEAAGRMARLPELAEVTHLSTDVADGIGSAKEAVEEGISSGKGAVVDQSR